MLKILYLITFLKVFSKQIFKNILVFLFTDLCVDNHYAQKAHCLLTTILKDQYSGRSWRKIFSKICSNATKTFFTEK